MDMSTYIKPVVAAATAAALDRFVCDQRDTKRNAIFGASVGLGIFGASLVAPMVPEISFLNMTSMGVKGKTVGVRVVEIGLGAGAVYAITNFVTKSNDLAGGQLYKKLGCILVADFVGEYAGDYMATRPLSFFA